MGFATAIDQPPTIGQRMTQSFVDLLCCYLRKSDSALDEIESGQVGSEVLSTITSFCSHGRKWRVDIKCKGGRKLLQMKDILTDK